MTAQALTFVPAPCLADHGEHPEPLHQVVYSPANLAHPAPDDVVMLPRHIADAAYHVLQAVQALKDNGHQELFSALSKALDEGRGQAQPEASPSCEVCHLEVGIGTPHHPECWSPEATAHRATPVPRPEPLAHS